MQSCGILGIHFKVHNPKKAGKLPKFSEESVLLGEMTDLRSCFDVHYYDLAANIHPDSKSLSGVVEIHAVAETDFDSLQIDLHPNFKIKKLMDPAENKEINYLRKERAVMMKHPQKKGNRFVLQVEYEGKPHVAKKAPWKGGFVWKKDKKGKPWIGVACESDGASIWWPLKDHTADEPDSVRMHYTVPEDLVAVGNGQFEGETTDGKQTTYHWFVSYPVNTYNITVYAGDFKNLQDTYKGINGEDLSLDYYVLDENYEKAKSHFKQVHPILKVYEEKFGEYPWYADGFKLVESPYAGMEHQTAIAYGNGYKNGSGSDVDYIILHEVAHEWWGNSITAKDLADVWLQEGFATYAEALYYEDTAGKAGYDRHLALYKIFIKNKYPVVGVKDRRWFHYKKSSDAYMKGAWILQTLRIQINDDPLFFDILKSFYQTYKYQLVESKDFIELVNEKTNSNYSWFFDQYLNKNLVPEFEYAYTEDGGFYYRWSNMSRDFTPFKIRMKTQDRVIELIPSDKTQLVMLPKDSYGSWNFQLPGDVLCAFKENKAILK